mmetsp:Transcript_52703/g.115537  ORF Transcript_52703/g.115537 Transcript_52703/m.115537 type:complete len:206 (+) Transcript_52703:731-1348(+)
MRHCHHIIPGLARYCLLQSHLRRLLKLDVHRTLHWQGTERALQTRLHQLGGAGFAGTQMPTWQQRSNLVTTATYTARRRRSGVLQIGRQHAAHPTTLLGIHHSMLHRQDGRKATSAIGKNLLPANQGHGIRTAGKKRTTRSIDRTGALHSGGLHKHSNRPPNSPSSGRGFLPERAQIGSLTEIKTLLRITKHHTLSHPTRCSQAS